MYWKCEIPCILGKKFGGGGVGNLDFLKLRGVALQLY